MSCSSSGILNDINKFDQSELLVQFVDGTFSRDVDVEFEVAGETFDEMCFLVDGIYPGLSRFVKTLDSPVGKEESDFTLWQESTRKSIERTSAVCSVSFISY
jgi:hypothetical protein